MKRLRGVAAGLVVVAGLASAGLTATVAATASPEPVHGVIRPPQEDPEIVAMREAMNQPVEPFAIADNLFYVGASSVTAFLLTGPEEHVLIDGGFPQTAPMITASIAKLGFDIGDVKALLNSHAHFDHAGGLAALQEASGAEVWISEPDADVIANGGLGGPLVNVAFPAPRVDHRFGDGDVVRVGPLRLTAHVTAGHTPGCTSWSFMVQDGGQPRLAVSVCSLTVLPGVSLVEPETYPGIRADFERSFATLRELPVDIFLASHASFFGMRRKLQERDRIQDLVMNPFLDRAGYHDYIDRAESAFREELASQRSAQ